MTHYMDGALGSSIKLNTKKMETYTIAAILEKNNESHAAADVGEMMPMRLEERLVLIVLYMVVISQVILARLH